MEPTDVVYLSHYDNYVQVTPTPDHSEHRAQKSKHRSHSKRKMPDFRGGAFVRIDHV